MRIVFAFDRDDTLTNSPKTGPIPIEWVRHLARETDHEVWATGNQKLKSEADLPGTDELIAAYRERWGDPKDRFLRRGHPKFERAVEEGPGQPAPDLDTAVYLHEGHETPRGFPSEGSLTREQRLRLLHTLFPDHDWHVVIDNKYLEHLRGWTHFYPDEFGALVETFAPLLELGEPDDVVVPDYYDWPPDETA